MSFGELPEARNSKVIKWPRVWIVTISATILYLYIEYWPQQLRLLCPIHAVTGFYCPGCGSTRAVKAVLNGDLPLAFHDNALLLVSPVAIATALLIEKYSQKRIWLYAFLSIVLVAVVIFTVIRNQPGSKFAPL
jgi:hypothetical protein